MLATMSLLNKQIAYRPWRPPTAVYPDRHQVAQYRLSQFPPTAADWERIFCINLEGAFFSPGALKEMIVPLGQAVRAGAYGNAALVVVTSDDSTVEFLEALAEKYELPIFVSSSPDAAQRGEARPIGALTTAEIETYGLIRSAGGEVTSSRMAGLAGIEVNAARNCLSSLEKKGYVHRINRSRREGDAFVDLLSAAQQNYTSTADPQTAVSINAFDIPEEVRKGVELLASAEGVDPREVLVRAWHEFLEKHREVLNSESKEVRRMLQESNHEDLAAFVNRSTRERAKNAASRIKR